MGMSRPRPSSLQDHPQEQRITEDGFEFKDGDRLFNYYDCKWGIVVDRDPAIYRDKEWFTFEHEDGTRTTLNAVRVSKNAPSWWKEKKDA